MSFPKRLLALEVRTGRLGFAVFEGPKSLLDWGVRTFEKGKQTIASSVSERLRVLFAFYSPAEIVLCAHVYDVRSHKIAYSSILKSAKSEARSHSIKVSVLSARQVRTSFAKHGKIIKHDIALTVVGQFPELSWKLPRRRKFYQSERAVMLVFDAAANGIAYFQRQSHSSFETHQGI
jgi:hypothetical protein